MPLRALSASLYLLAAALSPDDLAALLARVSDTTGTYLLLALATFPTSELAPVFGGLAAYEGALRFVPVVAAVTLGGWSVTSVLYWLGRRHWDALRKRWPGVRGAGTLALRVVRRNPIRASLLVRFLFGARVLLPIACGAAAVPAPRYLALSFVGSLLWATVYVGVGALAGEAAEQILAKIGAVENVVFVLIGAVVVAFALWWRRRQRRRAERRARASARVPG